MKHEDIWNDFCSKQKVIEHAALLFETDNELSVATREIGKTNKRRVLSRSESMMSLVIEQTEILTTDISNGSEQYDGLIYIMFFIEGNSVKPLYIGKTESKGRKNPLSVNISKLKTDKSKFARWGDNYQYHIGDLSAITIPGHDKKHLTHKYKDWAETLFTDYPVDNPVLKKQVYFWCTAWNRNEVGIWNDFGQTRLTFLEYLMIGVASSAFPKLLLNREGQSRS